MGKLGTKLGMVALAAMGMGLFPARASAQDLNLNICERLLEDLFVPPTFTELRTCKMPSNRFKRLGFCAVLPHCCVPGVCLVDPMCFTARTVQTAAGYWKYKGEVYCTLKTLTPRALLNGLLMRTIENAGEVLTGGTFDRVINLVQGDLDIIYARGQSIPGAWKNYLKDYIQPVYNNGATGFAYGDLDGARIISGSDALAKMWLQNNADAITLGNVIVIKSDLYDVIRNQSITSFQHTKAQMDALQVLAHEMVHVKQYRTLGRDRFLKEYVMQSLLHGFTYCQDPFEQEAYTFELTMARTWGGELCNNAMANRKNDRIKDCNLGVAPVTCNTDPGVCGASTGTCARAPKTLYRVTMTCDGKLASAGVAAIDLASYRNYTCSSRYQAQCIQDGSFDAYYMEWCEYQGPACKQLTPREYACDPGITPPGSCKVTKVHRTQHRCDGTALGGEQVFDLATTSTTYTCGNQFFQGCVQDGTWDTYTQEWCEYACQYQ